MLNCSSEKTEKHAVKENKEKTPEKQESGSLLTSRRIVLRLVFVVATVILARFYYAPKSEGGTLASADETVARKTMEVKCSADYAEDLKNFPGGETILLLVVLDLLYEIQNHICISHHSSTLKCCRLLK